jgi:phosphopantetheinyl transferase
MGKIFYADKSAFTTEAALKQILSAYYGMVDATILRTEHGKPYVVNGPHFSVTHTKNRLYIAFSAEEIGLDAESALRAPYYETIVKKFPTEEADEIDCAEAFLTHWVVKESAVKYMGGTLALDLYKLAYINGCISYDGAPMSAKITLLRHEEFILSICGNTLFKDVEFIPLTTL